MATIRKRGDRFQVEIRRADKPSISRTFNRFKEAKEWGRLTETQIDRADLTPDRSILKELTLADLIIRYIDEVSAKKKTLEFDILLQKGRRIQKMR